MKKRPLWSTTKSQIGNGSTPDSSSERALPLIFTEYLTHPEKGTNQKHSTIYRELRALLKRFPLYFDDSLLTSCARLQILSSNEFFEERSALHLIRLVCSHYFIYRELARSLRLFPEERHLFFRLIPVHLQFPFGTKFALGLAIGICPLSEYELFGEKHILMAVQQLMPFVSVVQGSFYVSQNPQDHIHLLYIEIEKNDGSRFTPNEIRELKSFLANTLKARVEKLLPPLFMTRNEEEVIKTILILGQELRHRRSMPQVVISFESQSQAELFFTVIIVHLTATPERSFRKIALGTTECTWIAHRIQLVDYLEEKIPKEAVVFHVTMKKSASLLRADFSVNFYLARQGIVEALQSVLGPIRDYNGGLIVQQGEQLSEFKREFAKEIASCPELAENFFYSLAPIEVQATLGQELLNKLFSLCLEASEMPLPKRNSYFSKVETEGAHTFVVIRMRDPMMKDCFLNRLTVFGADHHFISTMVVFQGCYIFGYIHTPSADCSTEQFISVTKQALAEGLEKISSLRALRLAFPNLPVSLDPRIGGDSYSAMILNMLFEGLMKYGDDGELTYGLCESVDISSDTKTYTFHLRKSTWSNGSPVTAHDFAYAWKKILSPDFYTPYAYLFYPIKYSKPVKEGKQPPHLLGIQPIDDHTLVVELEHPTPYFLELTALSLYSPVPHALNNIYSDWAHQVGQDYVCNGPFQLTKRSRAQGLLELGANPFYWDPQPAQPDQVVIIQSNAQTALQMFKNDEIDWLGSPLQDWNPQLFTEFQDQAESIISSGMFWTRFNVQRFPFHNVKLRQAFSYAINRKKLVETLAYGGLPAFSPLPIMHCQKIDTALFPDNDEEKAVQLFQEALQELGITKEEFPPLSFIHGVQDVLLNNAIKLVTQRWKELFGIECRVEQYRWSTVFDKSVQGDFQISFMCWETWVDDPIYTLNAFKHKDEKINPSKWENPMFQTLLDMADQTTDMKTRNEYLAKAEAILIQEAPVLPLLYDIQQFIKKSHVHVPNHKNTGKLSLRSASIFKKSHLQTIE